MSNHLYTYLQDHLAGAKFAINLLKDLSAQSADAGVAQLAASLLPEIESDRLLLENLAKQIGGDSSTLKDAAAWVAQKAGGLKLTVDEPLGVFEAIELLSLGVLGKLALWNALDVVRTTDGRFAEVNFQDLATQATTQHQQLESSRLRLAATVLPAVSA